MNPPQIPSPPQITETTAVSEPTPLGTNPEELQSISNFFVAVEAILRQPRRVMLQLRKSGAPALILILFFGFLACALLYGLVVGTFTMGTQLWAAPLKIAGGLMVTGIICLPSLYIFTCMSGSRAGLQEICGLVVGLLMLTTLLLVGFAPIAWLFSQSTESIAWMGGLHLAFWLIATCFGLRFLVQGFSYSQARSLAGLRTWILIFILVSLQMTTALRPILGKADTLLPPTKKFFVSHWADCLNARPAPAPQTP